MHPAPTQHIIVCYTKAKKPENTGISGYKIGGGGGS